MAEMVWEAERQILEATTVFAAIGCIVNCSSLGGLVGLPQRAAYRGTKHALIGMTKSAGVEFGTRSNSGYWRDLRGLKAGIAANAN